MAYTYCCRNKSNHRIAKLRCAIWGLKILMILLLQEELIRWLKELGQDIEDGRVVVRHLIVRLASLVSHLLALLQDEDNTHISFDWEYVCHIIIEQFDDHLTNSWLRFEVISHHYLVDTRNLDISAEQRDTVTSLHNKMPGHAFRWNGTYG